MKVRVSNIQRFSLHDGPGIRTTVFMKGCNLKCPWCCNPENIDYNFTAFNNLNVNEKGIFGFDIELDELYDELIKDSSYFKINNGGITFSGGEPLLQIKKLEPLLIKLKKHNINLCLETALQVPFEFVEIASKYFDEIIIDIKILEDNVNKEVLGGNLKYYYKNVEFLHKNKKIYKYRIPLNNEYILKRNNIKLIKKFIEKYPNNVEIFSVHNLAENKYKSIGKDFVEFEVINSNRLMEIKKFLSEDNILVDIINI